MFPGTTAVLIFLSPYSYMCVLVHVHLGLDCGCEGKTVGIEVRFTGFMYSSGAAFPL